MSRVFYGAAPDNERGSEKKKKEKRRRKAWSKRASRTKQRLYRDAKALNMHAERTCIEHPRLYSRVYMCVYVETRVIVQ